MRRRDVAETFLASRFDGEHRRFVIVPAEKRRGKDSVGKGRRTKHIQREGE